MVRQRTGSALAWRRIACGGVLLGGAVVSACGTAPATTPAPVRPDSSAARAARVARDSVADATREAARAAAARDAATRAGAREAAARDAAAREAAAREAAARAAARDSARLAARRTAARRAARDSAAARLARLARAPGAPGAPHATRARQPGDVRLCAGGDVSLGTNVDTSWTALAARRARRPVAAFPQPDSLLAALRPLVADADVVLLNVEGAIGEGSAPSKCGPRSTGCFALRQPPATAGALRRFGGDAIVVGNVANNHARDAGLAGFAETRQRLADAGVLVTGADSEPTVVVTPAGDTLAFLGFSPSAFPDVRDTATVRRLVARAAASYGRVVVTMHLGAEGAGAQHTRDAMERYYGAGRGNPVAFAAAAIAGGAAVVIGHGPHVVRAVEWRDGRLVAYSLGNLATYGPFVLRDPLDRGAIVCATLAADGTAWDAELRSTRQRIPGIPSPDPEHRAARLADQLGRADFPETGARVDRVGRVLPPR